MKINILTGRFGMGHITVAKAIKEHIKNSCPNVEVEVIDWFDYISPKLAQQYYIFFELIVNKGFRLYNTRYRLLENMKTDQKPELYGFFKWHFKKYIQERKPDMIISTLPLCSQLASMYKEKSGSATPLITCVTDITGHSEWINKNTDYYMVGSYIVRDKFIKKGVSPYKIYETGIPVRAGFNQNEKFTDSNHYGRRQILLMGGGLGILPAENEFYQDLEGLSNVDITVITGKNDILFQQLAGKYRNITVLGYVHNVYDYMKQADVVITKPGGVTTFEAIHAELPILSLTPFLQQEIHNAAYIEVMNIGKVIDMKGKEFIQEIRSILEEGHLEEYKNNILKIKSGLKENMEFLTQLIEAYTIDNINNTTCFCSDADKRMEALINEKISFNL
ncbi:UDP-N-acetylglucosamine--N-acetylmuramyl-(pentape ptide) pyrophosphoryl-UDP N-acetylglucosamine transferase [Anaerocolumna cellulosilytica]|uniref:UDP-N-acetylglucosamine--N-acetylmuramyl-(Pentape ptide) pyrophosphoryl-UDP N-acetylglucosamine transferase n=1 Tax=Anaerocolumna cellulosilytica TaxID=433286 RepID=A0A6S6QU36_9FIRM|nr:glycosyltransferase [Anaerocolumna cellulosilytica]MBB5197875.1 UDP-N-acetylglucosamine:LPS N-acetylglucosamine transferase [Anaerocolumna cellulosilytica]BCJ93186.1 UDP-N-acetylglucosamine--N-acetylmuramyl-(pentape ptide) pyrophosphoryl-UDP N-acetylglucosamine transferase [Anaerocolumna cellulosilytica]